jgi:glycosyltransferase involved in cell wall biosynthesis
LTHSSLWAATGNWPGDGPDLEIVVKLIQALPRRMCFGAASASSIELCVAGWIAGSQYRRQTTVFADHGGGEPLMDVEVFRLPRATTLSSWRLAYNIRQRIERENYELIVTQQHVATAARIAAFNRRAPVILQTHNFIDPPRTGPGAWAYNRVKLRQFQNLSGLTLISEATKSRFEEQWPNVTIPRAVISNGLDFSSWHAETEKENLIVVVGRAHETKGIVESALGVATFLATSPEWRASFILSRIDGASHYFKEVCKVLAPFSDQCDIEIDIPFERVQQITERAAISVVASKWAEPFGRTALEAHAAGAALISSGTGGLREISANAAEYLTEISGPAIAEKLSFLNLNEVRRKQIATEGAARVRRHFRLAPRPQDRTSNIPAICERLDRFYEEVLTRHESKFALASTKRLTSAYGIKSFIGVNREI